MELNHLRAFAAVAREGNLTRAAKRLFLTQPAVSLQLKALQEELRLALFTRTPTGLVLSEDGRKLLPIAERVLAGLEEIRSASARLSNVTRGPLRIGTIVDPEFTRLGHFLKLLVGEFPLVEPQLAQGISGQVLKRIEEGRADVGYYIGRPDAGRFLVKTLAPFTYRVIAPRGWRDHVAGRDWRELAELPWIWTPPESAHSRLLAPIFSERRVEPRVVAVVDQEASMLDLVRCGVGLALARDSIARREAEARGIVIADAVAIETELTFVLPRERGDEPLLNAALSVLERVWE